MRFFRRRVCAKCGFPAQRGNPLVKVGDFRVHRSHLASIAAGFTLRSTR